MEGYRFESKRMDGFVEKFSQFPQINYKLPGRKPAHPPHLVVWELVNFIFL